MYVFHDDVRVRDRDDDRDVYGHVLRAVFFLDACDDYGRALKADEVGDIKICDGYRRHILQRDANVHDVLRDDGRDACDVSHDLLHLCKNLRVRDYEFHGHGRVHGDDERHVYGDDAYDRVNEAAFYFAYQEPNKNHLSHIAHILIFRHNQIKGILPANS